MMLRELEEFLMIGEDLEDEGESRNTAPAQIEGTNERK
jgi:hypothetical protein